MNLTISNVIQKDQPLQNKAQDSQQTVIPGLNQKEVIGSKGASALKAMVMAKVAFSGNTTLINPVYYAAGKSQTEIPDLFAIDAKVVKVPAREKLHGYLEVEKEFDFEEGKDIVIVRDNDYKEIAQAKITPGYKGVKISYIDGKAGPGVHIDVPKGPNNLEEDLHLILLPGSKISKKDFEVKMPGKLTIPGKRPKMLSFAGGANDLYYITAYKAGESRNSIDRFYKEGVYKIASQEGEPLENDYNVIITAGGFGDRYGHSTVYNGDNKVSALTPGGLDLVHYITARATSSGCLENSENVNIKEYEEPNPMVGNAGGTIELAEKFSEILENDKPLVVLPGDGISDFDLNKALKDFESKPDAGAMIIATPIQGDKIINTFGIMGRDENNVITEFIEKPKTVEALVENGANAIVDDGGNKENPLDEKYLVNTAIYIFKPEVFEEIKKFYDERREKGKIDLDYGGDVFPMLERACRHGDLKSKDGIPLKMYIHQAEGDWNDVGTTQATIDTSREIAKGDKFKNLPAQVRQSFADNVDLKTGVVGMPGTKDLFSQFLAEDGKAEGNIVVEKKR